MFFEYVGFTYVVLDLVCSAILPSDWLAEPCQNDAYVEELVSTKTSCFRTHQPVNKTVHMNCLGFFHYIFSFFFTVLVVHPHHDHPITTVLTHYSHMA